MYLLFLCPLDGMILMRANLLQGSFEGWALKIETFFFGPLNGNEPIKRVPFSASLE
jgi:hypothetical protein